MFSRTVNNTKRIEEIIVPKHEKVNRFYMKQSNNYFFKRTIFELGKWGQCSWDGSTLTVRGGGDNPHAHTTF